ncbi:DMT family transporter [Rhodovarius crocodyli]|uniref:DMT family transporter n=1 Tax=Rhodovarius crocodyli TaxID=1979269 RepID=UPI001F0C79F9|nr:DMT family transporter [Rhodovarius crocodyli]
MPSTRAVGLALLVVSAAGWGTNWPLLKVLLRELPPMSIRALGCCVAAMLLAGMARALGQSLYVPPGQRGRLVLAALLNVSAWMGFATIGLVWLPSSEASIVTYTAPIFTVLLAWPVLGERPGWRRVLAMVICFTGVAILFAGQRFDVGFAKLPGILSVITAGFCFGLGTVLGKRLPLRLPPVAMTAWQVGIGGLPLIPIALLLESPQWAEASWRAWALFAWMTVMPLGLAYLAWFEAVKRVPANLASLGTMMAPMFGVAGAALFLGEPFGPRQIAALILTVSGVALAARG